MLLYKNQQAYYDAIEKSTKQANSSVFIEFMLKLLFASLNEFDDGVKSADILDETDMTILKSMERQPKITLTQLGKKQVNQAERLRGA